MNKYQKDSIERIVRSFIGAVLTALVAGLAGVIDISSAKALGMSALMAGITAIISLIARNFGDVDSASFLKSESKSNG